ncbi:MAG: hypothetical protein Q9159_000302 [Coniocarpon cinnabarinum]
MTAQMCLFCDKWNEDLSRDTHALPHGDSKFLNGSPIVSEKQFAKHVGQHMEQLALFALPRAYEEDETAAKRGENDSLSRSNSRSTPTSGIIEAADAAIAEARRGLQQDTDFDKSSTIPRPLHQDMDLQRPPHQDSGLPSVDDDFDLQDFVDFDKWNDTSSKIRSPLHQDSGLKELAFNEEDLLSRPRCQRCRKSKKGCDRQRPCGRCKDASIGIEGCISEDEDNSRKDRVGQQMGLSADRLPLHLRSVAQSESGSTVLPGSYFDFDFSQAADGRINYK